MDVPTEKLRKVVDAVVRPAFSELALAQQVAAISVSMSLYLLSVSSSGLQSVSVSLSASRSPSHCPLVFVLPFSSAVSHRYTLYIHPIHSYIP